MAHSMNYYGDAQLQQECDSTVYIAPPPLQQQQYYGNQHLPAQRLFPIYTDVQPTLEFQNRNLNQEFVEQVQPVQGAEQQPLFLNGNPQGQHPSYTTMPQHTTYYGPQQPYPYNSGHGNVRIIQRRGHFLMPTQTYNNGPPILDPNLEYIYMQPAGNNNSQRWIVAYNQQPTVFQPESYWTQPVGYTPGYCTNFGPAVFDEPMPLQPEVDSHVNDDQEIVTHGSTDQLEVVQEEDEEPNPELHPPTTETLPPLCQEEGGSEEKLLQEEPEKPATLQGELAPTTESIPQHKENLWELICKFCPAVSSFSSPLASHICDRSLELSGNEEGIFCNTCFIRIPNEMPLKIHKETRRHRLAFINLKGDRIAGAHDIFYCSNCKVQCKTNTAYTEHMLSQKHATTEDFKIDDLYFCGNCDLSMDKIAYELHLSSTTHLLNSMISNARLLYSNYDFYASDLNCIHCVKQFASVKSFKKHLCSLEHCKKKLEINLKDDFRYNNQYVFFDSETIICVLCNISIANQQCLLIHFQTDEHIINENIFEENQYRSFVFGLSNLTTNVNSYHLSCSDCKQLKRDCEHMFENEKQYLTWKKKADKDNFCKYCNCIKDKTHESSELHQMMLATVKYCQLCDKILSTDLAEHVNRKAHWRSSLTFLRKTFEKELRQKLETELMLLSPEEVQIELEKQVVKALREERRKPFEEKRKIEEEKGKYKRGPYKLFCAVCNLLSDTEPHHINHLSGFNHRRMYNTTCLEKIFHCRPCGFRSTEFELYENHLNSDSHLTELDGIQKEFDRYKFCFICLQKQISITEHVRSHQHIETIKLFRNT